MDVFGEPVQRDGRFILLTEAARFVGRHPAQFVAVGIVTALGRAAQQDAFGPMGSAGTLALELVVGATRTLLFLSAFGDGRVAVGARIIRRAFAQATDSHIARRADERAALWRAVGWGCGAFLLLALICNGAIALVAQNGDVLEAINQRLSFTNLNSTALTLILKNLTIISFTLVFVALVTKRFLIREDAPRAGDPGCC